MPLDRRRSLRKGHDDLHGNAPDQSQAVLLLIDVINDLSFPDNQDLVLRSVALAKSIAKLKKRCKKSGIPAIYVNDNRGRWRSDLSAVLRHCLDTRSPGREMTRMLVPEADDYIVFKPKHSPFYATPLQTILDSIGARVANEPGRVWREAAEQLRPGRLCGCPHRARTPAFTRRHEG